jgi:hypothetical protein
MGLAMFLFGVFVFLAVILLIIDQEVAALLCAGGAVCCFVVIITMINIQNTCQDYGKFNVGGNFYQCQQIQEPK